MQIRVSMCFQNLDSNYENWFTSWKNVNFCETTADQHLYA